MMLSLQIIVVYVQSTLGHHQDTSWKGSLLHGRLKCIDITAKKFEK